MKAIEVGDLVRVPQDAEDDGGARVFEEYSGLITWEPVFKVEDCIEDPCLVKISDSAGGSIYVLEEYVTVLSGDGEPDPVNQPAHEYKYGDPLYVSPDATDSTEWPLFGEEGYGFDYLPPYTFVDEEGDGDLVVKDPSGELVEVSPQFVHPLPSPWERDLQGRSQEILDLGYELDAELVGDPVNQPAHYKGEGDLEVIDVIEAFGLNYRVGNAVKYILRAGKKGSEADAITDLRKAARYINREINAREGSASW